MYNDSDDYEGRCLAWQLAQPNDVIRSLATDYSSGEIDECTRDAAHEYLRRWPKSKAAPRIRRMMLSEVLGQWDKKEPA